MNPSIARPLLRAAPLLFVALALAWSAALPGCAAGQVRTPDRGVLPPFDGPSVLSRTIGASATLIGAEPQLVSGIGIVVGVKGRGGPLPENVESELIRELSLREGARGVDMFYGTPFEGESPRSFLRRSDVAVVTVVAAISPGLPEGTRFDAWVVALNANTGVESLAGGHLWRTDLRLGAPMRRGLRAREIAYVEGPVYVNPFARGARASATEGRIIGGGVVTDPLDLAIRLNAYSPRRTREIASVLNSRFGTTRFDRGDVASGRLTGEGDSASAIIRLTVPWSYKDNAADFINLVRYTHPDSQGREDRYAARYARALIEEPAYADALAWSLEAIGLASLPHVRPLYDYPEYAPRMAALRVGARLGDEKAWPYLLDLARYGDEAERVESLELLGVINKGPIDFVIEQQAGDGNVSVRVAAYEAMERRAGQFEFMSMLRRGAIPPGQDPVPILRDWYDAARLGFRGSLDAGLRRDLTAAGFVVDRVPLGDPLIWIRQQGVAGVVLFGSNLEIAPGAVLAMEDGNLTVVRGREGGPVRVRYRHDPGGWTVNIADAPTDLHEFIDFLTTEPTMEDPDLGLGMSFGGVVGVLSRLQEDNGIVQRRPDGDAVAAAWRVEPNRLLDDLRGLSRRAAEDREELEVVPDDEEDEFDPFEDLLNEGLERDPDDGPTSAGGR
ncbi:MAG: flagellar basal body P-ring protein FlgI [Planctomycetota bacterium]